MHVFSTSTISELHRGFGLIDAPFVAAGKRAFGAGLDCSGRGRGSARATDATRLGLDQPIAAQATLIDKAPSTRKLGERHVRASMLHDSAISPVRDKCHDGSITARFYDNRNLN
jgi:hypothetical protein